MPPNNNRCFGCKENISENDEFEFIFGEIGEEMNIQKLLNDCFNVHIKKDDTKFQALCESCLTDLVETFDKIEHTKIESKSAKTDLASVPSKDKDETKSNESNDSGDDNNDNCNTIDNNDYIIKTREDLVDKLKKSKEITEEDHEMKNIDYIIEDICEDEEIADDILAEFTVENVDGEEILIMNSDAQSVDEDEQNIQEIILTIDNEENCDDPDENQTKNSREDYVEIDYLDDADDVTKLEDYLQKSLCDFKDVTLSPIINCRFCNETLDTHGRLLSHYKDKHNDEEPKFECIVDENCEKLNSFQDLSNHLLLKHYDLRVMTIYSQCMCCTKRFNNLIMLNKHSCDDSRTISRSATECNTCEKIFRSNKRYRFHIQFHLDKYRPKACLICRKFYGDDDDDELFEHIMYEREPDDAFICKLCDINFLLSETYESHKNIHHLRRPYACTFCDKTYLSSQQLQDHLNAQHLQKKLYKCQLCNKEFFKRNVLHKHILSHKSPVEVSVFSCSSCGFLGKNRETVKTHVDKEHTDIDTINIMDSMYSIGYCCEYCEIAFDTIENLLSHRNKHDNNIYECQLCSLTYDSYKKAKIHRQTHQKYADLKKKLPVTRHYVCDFEGCTNNYDQWINLVGHKRNTHIMGNNQPYKCEECNLACANKRNYTQHMQEKHGKQPEFPCSFCPKVYSTSMAIAVHVARMHNNNKLACKHCGTLCKNKEALEKHIINTHAKLKCQICEKQLKNMKNLKTHIKMVHQKEKRFFCQYCKRGYYNNCDRLIHEQAIHLKTKQFNCDICDYSTPYRESISSHQKNHNNNKPHECILCNKKFTRRYALTLHQRRHAGVKRYSCPHKGCNNSYPNQSILSIHIKRKHGDDTVDWNGNPLKKSKLAKMLEKGIPDDYLLEENDIPEEDDINLEEIYLIQNGTDIFGNESPKGSPNESPKENPNESPAENDSNKDDTIEYIFTKLNDDDDGDGSGEGEGEGDGEGDGEGEGEGDGDGDNEENESTEFIDTIEDVEMEGVETIALSENDEHNYILTENEEIEGYEIIEE